MRGSIGKFGAAVLLCCLTLSATARQRSTEDERVRAAEALAKYEQVLQASDEPEKRFYLTTKTAATALAAGDMAKAKTYSQSLLEQAPAMRGNWNYGNAVHVANLALGAAALSAGDVTEAKRLLLEAGRTPGSPQLNSFGPNMLLAKELLAKGEWQTVLQYFELCANFWKDSEGRLAAWKAAVQEGKQPDFGANLSYQLGNWRFEDWDKLRP